MNGNYFDYAASTPVHPDVIAKMHAFLTQPESAANPSSLHHLGRANARVIAAIKQRMLKQINGHSGDLIWTSGATESINLALQGAALAYKANGKHIISVKTEHAATLGTLAYLEKQGFRISLLDVDAVGMISTAQLENAIRPDTILFSVSHIQNELGIVQPVTELARVCRQHGIISHLDAAQSIAKIPIDVERLGYDLISFSASKCYGPKGIGALYLNNPKSIRLQALHHGSQQQLGYRPGTLPTHLIVGMDCAWEIAAQMQDHQYKKISSLRQLINQQLQNYMDIMTCSVNAVADIAMYIPRSKLDHDQLSSLRDHYSIGSGAACSSAAASHVLLALGISSAQASQALRISLGLWSNAVDTTKLCNDIINLCTESACVAVHSD